MLQVIVHFSQKSKSMGLQIVVLLLLSLSLCACLSKLTHTDSRWEGNKPHHYEMSSTGVKDAWRISYSRAEDTNSPSHPQAGTMKTGLQKWKPHSTLELKSTLLPSRGSCKVMRIFLPVVQWEKWGSMTCLWVPSLSSTRWQLPMTAHCWLTSSMWLFSNFSEAPVSPWCLPRD